MVKLTVPNFHFENSSISAFKYQANYYQFEFKNVLIKKPGLHYMSPFRDGMATVLFKCTIGINPFQHYKPEL